MTTAKSVLIGIILSIAGLVMAFFVYKKYDKTVQSIRTIAAHQK